MLSAITCNFLQDCRQKEDEPDTDAPRSLLLRVAPRMRRAMRRFTDAPRPPRNHASTAKPATH